ncbi:MAG: zinc finger domain-containing protein [Halobacteriales archaeon]|nr:zinc finger domain-containing protein [Halobacteriales archaeon]
MPSVPVTSLRLTETCSSCGVRLLGKGSATFACPSCGAGKLGRCAQCRDQSVTYTCAECGFQGP